MANGIQSAVNLYDGMTPALRRIVNSMNMVISSFETLHGATSEPLDMQGLEAAREQLQQADVLLQSMETNIQQADTAQNRFNNSVRTGGTAANGLERTFKRMAATVATTFGITKTLGLSDNLANTKSRLDLMNDGLQTTVELQNMIYESAQNSRGSFLDNTAVVSKLGILAGKSFSSNAEMIDFVELMNKNFVIGGASSSEQSSAMYQLTQAMASGRLQGDEYRSIIENAPLLAQAIEDYMKGAGVEGTMKDWASEGLLTADVIKGALFSSADEIEARFENMPITFGQIWTSIKNQAIVQFEPILTKLNEIANSDRFKRFTDGAINALSRLADAALWAFEVIVDLGTYIQDNWSTIEPIVLGIVSAYITWEVATKAVAIAHMALSPVNLIIGSIALAVGAVVTANGLWEKSLKSTEGAQNDFADKIDVTNQSTYIAAQRVEVLMRRYEELESAVDSAQEDHDTMNSIVLELERLIPGLSNQIRTEAGYIDDLSASLKIATDRFREFATAQAYYKAYSDKLQNAINDKIAMEDEYKEFQTVYKNRMEVGQVSVAGGASITYDDTNDWIAKDRSYNAKIDEQQTFIEDIINKMKEYQPGAEAYEKEYGRNQYGSKIASNTEEIKNTLSDELTDDIKYLKDIAERESVNRFTTAEIQVNLGGVNNTVNEKSDLDGVVSYLSDKLTEELSSVAAAYNGEV